MQVESTSYFVVAESLANVAKYAATASAPFRRRALRETAGRGLGRRRRRRRLGRGTGLAGLADRVRPSPVGSDREPGRGGTKVSVELPVAMPESGT